MAARTRIRIRVAKGAAGRTHLPRCRVTNIRWIVTQGVGTAVVAIVEGGDCYITLILDGVGSPHKNSAVVGGRRTGDVNRVSDRSVTVSTVVTGIEVVTVIGTQ